MGTRFSLCPEESVDYPSDMASTIACPKCHAQYQFEPRFAGRTIRCRRCSTLIRIDSSPQPPE